MFNRYELYTLLKIILAKYGAIPSSEKEYESLIIDLLDLIKKCGQG